MKAVRKASPVVERERSGDANPSRLVRLGPIARDRVKERGVLRIDPLDAERDVAPGVHPAERPVEPERARHDGAIALVHESDR